MTRRLLLDWLSAENCTTGIHFARSGEQWELWSYPTLARLVRRVAWGLVERGVGKDDRVVIVGCEGPEFVAALFGTILAGAIPAPMASPAAFQQAAYFQSQFEAVQRAARPALIVARTDLIDELTAPAAHSGIIRTITVATLVAGVDEDQTGPVCALSDVALIQFTSGSTGRCRGVRVSFDSLECNVEMIWRWLGWTPADPFATWLPLHHDMGLIGGLLASVAQRSELWLMQPVQFVRQPLRYLQCFGAMGARLSVTATFAMDLILRRIRPEWLEGMDFSAWRAMVVGAERIDARLLEQWQRLLGPRGFRRAAILPAYGLAEATLAVTGLSLAEEWTAVTVNAALIGCKRSVAIVPGDDDGPAIVGCGHPLSGVVVTIVGEDGKALPEGAVGEIVVQGPALASGYVGADDTGSFTSFAGGQLRTGDAGFLLQEQLFVLGRLGDSLKVRGRTVFGEDIEIALAAIGIPRLRVVVLLGSYQGKPTAVALFERPQPEWLPAAERQLRLHAGEAELILLDVPKGTIRRTTSGKPKRRELWQSFASGQLNGTPLASALASHTFPGTA